MTQSPGKRSEEFLKISAEFRLGALVTESSHPVTANLSEVAKRDIGEALDLLFEVDGDVVAKYREFAGSGLAGYGNNNDLRTRRIGNLFICGDEKSETSEAAPPLAPRVGIVANLQANQAVEILLDHFSRGRPERRKT